MEYPITQTDWVNLNKNNYDFYYNTYTFLQQNNFILPIDQKILLDFYDTDLSSRNLPINSTIENNYEFLFEYFLANYPIRNDSSRQQGKTELGYILSSIPTAVKTTFQPISSVVSGVGNLFSTLSNPIIFIVIMAVVIYFLLKIK